MGWQSYHGQMNLNIEYTQIKSDAKVFFFGFNMKEKTWNVYISSCSAPWLAPSEYHLDQDVKHIFPKRSTFNLTPTTTKYNYKKRPQLPLKKGFKIQKRYPHCLKSTDPPPRPPKSKFFCAAKFFDWKFSQRNWPKIT